MWIDTDSSPNVALDGRGLAHLPLGQVRRHLDYGDLAHVLREFAPDLPGCHLYYLSRRLYYLSRRYASTVSRLPADTPRCRI